jgi:hypothetical protein
MPDETPPEADQKGQIWKSHRKFLMRFQVEQDFGIILKSEGLPVWASV